MLAPSLLAPPTPSHATERPGVSRQRPFPGGNGYLQEPPREVDVFVDADGNAHLRRPTGMPLRQDERRQRAMLESIADVVVVVNRGGVILFHNRAVRRVLGYGRDELAGSSIFELIHDEDLPQFYSAFFNVIEGFIEYATAQFRHRARDGTYRGIEATVGILRGVPFAGVVFSFRPIMDPYRAAH